MKNSKNYEINFAAKEIIITKKFSKAAGTIGSTEYKDMITLRKDFPDFEIKLKSIEKKENKVSYSGLSVVKMQAIASYLSSKSEENKPNEEEFNKCVEFFQGQKGKYATLKALFLEKYKEDYNSLNNSDWLQIEKIMAQNTTIITAAA